MNIISHISASLRLACIAIVLTIFSVIGAHAASHAHPIEHAELKEFSKSAVRECNKITYTLRFVVVSQGEHPEAIKLKDLWPTGLLPTSDISIAGLSSTVPNIVSNGAGWSIDITTPGGTGQKTNGYMVTITSTIDPLAIAAGDLVIKNQAELSFGHGRGSYKSDDPTTPAKGDATIVNVAAADVKKCMTDQGGDPIDFPSCFKADSKVVCGKEYGTYVVTLDVSPVGGVSPSHVQLTSLTSGVTIATGLSPISVVGGKVTFTVVGAKPGDVLTFDANGITAGGGSFDGADLCCTGQVIVTIPKDLDCPPPPTTISVKKVCDPVTKERGDLVEEGYRAVCHITVTTTGVVNNPINISEVLSGNGMVSYLSATDPWACAPSPVAGPAPMNCVLPANTMTGPTDTSVIDVLVTFKNLGDVKEAKNCAAAEYSGKGLKKSCDDFEYSESSINVEKKCAPAIYSKYAVGPAATGLGWHASCQITVTTTGPQSGVISVSDSLIGSGTVANMTASAPWTCATPTCTVNGGALNQVASTTVINATAVFNNSGDAIEAKNCARVAVAGKPVGKSCVPIVVEEFGSLTVTKEAAYNGNHILNVNFPIAVTCGGNTINTSVADSVPYVQTNIPLGTQCSVVEGVIPATGLCKEGQAEVWTTTYDPTGPVTVSSVAGATIAVKNVLSCEKTDSDISISKVCDPATPIDIPGVAAQAYQSICHITVATTGPISGTVTMADVLSSFGGTNVGNATAPAPWVCTGMDCTVDGSQLNQTSSSTVIDIPVTFNDAGVVVESNNCATIDVNGQTAQESCTGFTVEPVGSDVSISKVCGPAQQLDVPVLQFGASCVITVTTTGPISTHLVVADNLTGAGTISSFTQTSGTPWVFTPTQFDIEGTQLNQTSSVSVFNANVTFPVGATGQEASANNCAILGSDAHVLTEACDTISVGGDDLAISVTKDCSGLTELQNGGPWAGACQVTVNVTGGPMPPFISLGEALHDTNLTRNPPVMLTGMQSTDAWVCPTLGSGVAANDLVNCSIPGSSFPSSGTSIINFNVYVPRGTLPGEAENCVSAAAFQTPDAPSDPLVASEQICVPLPGEDVGDPPKDELGQITIEKEVIYDGGAISTQPFPIAVTCGGVTTNATVSPNQPYVQTGLALNTSCSVVEGASATTGLCPQGSVGTWATTYAPSTPVAASVAGGLITIVNRLDCNQEVDSRMYVKKVVVNNAPGSVEGMQFRIQSDCTNTTQPTGYAYFTDGQSILFHNYEAGMTCNLSEVVNAPTTACGDLKPVWTTTYDPAQTVVLQPNGTQVTVTNTLNCEPNETDGNPIKVNKVVVNNAPLPLESGMLFPIKVTCVKNVNGEPLDNDMTQNVGDGQTVNYLPYGAGFNCSATEGTIPPTNACGNNTPVWTTTYSAQPVAMTPAGETITVTNTLNCEPMVKETLTTFSVRKEASYNGTPITNIDFPMDVRCGKDGNQTLSVAGGQTEAIEGLPNGTTCTVTEGAIPNTGLCPAGTTEKWATTYNPANGSHTTSNLASVFVTVQNLLTCEDKVIDVIVNPPSLKCDQRSTRRSGDACVCRIEGAVKINKTSCACPTGTKERDGACRRNPPPPPPKCKADERRNGNGVCVKVQVTPKCGRNEKLNRKTNRCEFVQPVCGPGKVYSTKLRECVFKQKVCPQGFKLAPNRKACWPIVKECPAGTRRVGKACFPRIQSETCSLPNILIGGRCVKFGRGKGDGNPRDPKGTGGGTPRGEGGVKIPGL